MPRMHESPQLALWIDESGSVIVGSDTSHSLDANYSNASASFDDQVYSKLQRKRNLRSEKYAKKLLPVSTGLCVSEKCFLPKDAKKVLYIDQSSLNSKEHLLEATFKNDNECNIENINAGACRAVEDGHLKQPPNSELEINTEKFSVVRAAGTFFPEHTSRPIASVKNLSSVIHVNPYRGKKNNRGIKTAAWHRRQICVQPTAGTDDLSDGELMDLSRVSNLNEDQALPTAAERRSEGILPQDLSMRTTAQQKQEQQQKLHGSNSNATYFNIYFQQLLSRYQQHLLHSTLQLGVALPMPLTLPLPTAPTAAFLSLLAAAATSTTAATATSASVTITGLTTTASSESCIQPSQALQQQYIIAAAPAITSSTSQKAHLSPLPDRSQSSIPTGYLKFRFNEDCRFNHCGYRKRQSHFHCNRADCRYSFCDKKRFVQHTARHERLDRLMGDDFQQYPGHMNCGNEFCAYQLSSNNAANKKSSHFHCLKCEFICMDTNKVVAHRRLHCKMEYIRLAGFRKVLSTERCIAADNTNAGATSQENNCAYSLKQTHYHCIECGCSVLLRTQLATHRHRKTATFAAPTANTT